MSPERSVTHVSERTRLVFFKPITSTPAETNALITTKSGQAISLHLVSAGKAAANAAVDFLVEYRRPQGLLIDSGTQRFLVAETRPISSAVEAGPAAGPERSDPVAKQLEMQKSVPSPAWRGMEL